MTNNKINLRCAEALGKEVEPINLSIPDASHVWLIVSWNGTIPIIGGEWNPLSPSNRDQAAECRDWLLNDSWQLQFGLNNRHSILQPITPETFHVIECHPDEFYARALAWVKEQEDG